MKRSNIFQRLFNRPKLQLHSVAATRLDANDSIIIQIDPQFADQAEYILGDVMRLVGHERVIPIFVPNGMIKFYTVEHPYTIGIDPALSKDWEAKDHIFRQEYPSTPEEATKAEGLLKRFKKRG